LAERNFERRKKDYKIPPGKKEQTSHSPSQLFRKKMRKKRELKAIVLKSRAHFWLLPLF